MYVQIFYTKNFRSLKNLKMKNSSSILKRVVNENRKNAKAYAVTSCQFAIEKGGNKKINPCMSDVETQY